MAEDIEAKKKKLMVYDMLHDFAKGARCGLTNNETTELIKRVNGVTEPIITSTVENSLFNENAYESISRSAFNTLLQEQQRIFIHDSGPKLSMYNTGLSAYLSFVNKKLPDTPFALNLMTIAGAWDEAGKPRLGNVRAIVLPKVVPVGYTSNFLTIGTEKDMLFIIENDKVKISFHWWVETGGKQRKSNFVQIVHDGKETGQPGTKSTRVLFDFSILLRKAKLMGVTQICTALALMLTDSMKSKYNTVNDTTLLKTCSMLLSSKEEAFICAIVDESIRDTYVLRLRQLFRGLPFDQIANILFLVKHSMDTSMVKIIELLSKESSKYNVNVIEYVQKTKELKQNYVDITELVEKTPVGLFTGDRLCFINALYHTAPFAIWPKPRIKDSDKQLQPYVFYEATQQTKQTKQITPLEEIQKMFLGVKYDSVIFITTTQNASLIQSVDVNPVCGHALVQDACQNLITAYNTLLNAVKGFLSSLPTTSLKFAALALPTEPDATSVGEYARLASFFHITKNLFSQSWEAKLKERMDAEITSIDDSICQFASFFKELNSKIQIAEREHYTALFGNSGKPKEKIGGVQVAMSLYAGHVLAKKNMTNIRGDENHLNLLIALLSNNSYTRERLVEELAKTSPSLRWFFKDVFNAFGIVRNYNLNALFTSRKRAQETKSNQPALVATNLPSLVLPGVVRVVGEAFSVDVAKFDNLFASMLKRKLAGPASLNQSMSDAWEMMVKQHPAIADPAEKSQDQVSKLRTRSHKENLSKAAIVANEVVQVFEFTKNELLSAKETLEKEFLEYKASLKWYLETGHKLTNVGEASASLSTSLKTDLSPTTNSVFMSTYINQFVASTKAFMRSSVDVIKNVPSDIRGFFAMINEQEPGGRTSRRLHRKMKTGAISRIFSDDLPMQQQNGVPGRVRFFSSGGADEEDDNEVFTNMENLLKSDEYFLDNIFDWVEELHGMQSFDLIHEVSFGTLDTLKFDLSKDTIVSYNEVDDAYYLQYDISFYEAAKEVFPNQYIAYYALYNNDGDSTYDLITEKASRRDTVYEFINGDSITEKANKRDQIDTDVIYACDKSSYDEYIDRMHRFHSDQAVQHVNRTAMAELTDDSIAQYARELYEIDDSYTISCENGMAWLNVIRGGVIHLQMSREDVANMQVYKLNYISRLVPEPIVPEAMQQPPKDIKRQAAYLQREQSAKVARTSSEEDEQPASPATPQQGGRRSNNLFLQSSKFVNSYNQKELSTRLATKLQRTVLTKIVQVGEDKCRVAMQRRVLKALKQG